MCCIRRGADDERERSGFEHRRVTACCGPRARRHWSRAALRQRIVFEIGLIVDLATGGLEAVDAALSNLSATRTFIGAPNQHKDTKDTR